MGMIVNKYDYLTKKIRVKDDDILLDLLYISLSLHMMLIDFAIKADELGMPTVVITRVISDRTAFSTSDSHSQARAIDIRSREWSPKAIDDILIYMNNKYKDVGAVGSQSGKAHALIHHDVSLGQHFHLQIRPGII